MRVNNNVGAMNAHHNLSRVDWALGKSLEKLSSGLRINRASDDAGGLGVSEMLRAQTRGLAMAERNIQDGMGFLGTADAALNQVSDMLQRMRELAVQSANGTMTDTQRLALTAEKTELETEITRIGTSTTFNGLNVFTAQPTLQIGADTANTLATAVGAISAAALPTSANSATTVDITAQANANTAIDDLDDAIAGFNTYRASIGAQINRLEYSLATVQNTRENITAAESRIRDTDMASEMTVLTRNQILTQSATAMLAQANARPQSVLALLQ